MPPPAHPGGWRLRWPDGRWLDLEPARRRLAARDPSLAHNEALYREPITTLDAQLAAGRRVDHLRALAEPFGAAGKSGPATPDRSIAPGDLDDLALEAPDLDVGPPILRPGSLRDFYAFEIHVRSVWARRQTRSPRPGIACRSSTSATSPSCAARATPVWAPRRRPPSWTTSWRSARSSTPRPRTCRRSGRKRPSAASSCSTTGRPATCSATSPRSASAPPRARTSPTTIGPWLVTPDELADARAGKGYDLTMIARVNDQEMQPRLAGRPSHHSFGEMLARASADVRLRPGDRDRQRHGGRRLPPRVARAAWAAYLQPGDLVAARDRTARPPRNPDRRRALATHEPNSDDPRRPPHLGGAARDRRACRGGPGAGAAPACRRPPRRRPRAHRGRARAPARRSSRARSRRPLGLSFARVQGTPDLLPSDVTGSSMLAAPGGARGRASASSPAPSSPTSCWWTRSTAPRRAPSRRCWRRCRRAASRWTA